MQCLNYNSNFINSLPVYCQYGNILAMNAKIDIKLLNHIKTSELTTSMLLGLLCNYKDPRKKIHSLVKSGLLQSIKQGVYVVSENLGLRPYSLEILANLIYGPSYISLESALSYYGFIPERVSTTTSICIGRNKRFSTPVGEFEYCHLKDLIYSDGVQLREVFKDSFCQFASPEKAILDFIYIRETGDEFKDSKGYFNYIIESYRLDINALKKETSVKKLKVLTQHYSSEHVSWFTCELIKNT